MWELQKREQGGWIPLVIAITEIVKGEGGAIVAAMVKDLAGLTVMALECQASEERDAVLELVLALAQHACALPSSQALAFTWSATLFPAVAMMALGNERASTALSIIEGHAEAPTTGLLAVDQLG
ncbi:unnamed protein product, partial [Chrysoparadoxa australica]